MPNKIIENSKEYNDYILSVFDEHEKHKKDISGLEDTLKACTKENDRLEKENRELLTALKDISQTLESMGVNNEKIEYIQNVIKKVGKI